MARKGFLGALAALAAGAGLVVGQPPTSPATSGYEPPPSGVSLAPPVPLPPGPPAWQEGGLQPVAATDPVPAAYQVNAPPPDPPPSGEAPSVSPLAPRPTFDSPRGGMPPPPSPFAGTSSGGPAAPLVDGNVAVAQAPPPPPPPPVGEVPVVEPPPAVGRPLGWFGGAPGAPGCVPRFWTSAEYLMWWVKDAPVPVPLVTAGDPASANPGAITDPATSVLIGNHPVNFGMFSGMRATMGGWLDPAEKFGIEGSFFFLGRQSRTWTATSNAIPTPSLYAPVNSAVALPGFFPAGETAVPLSYPGVTTAVTATSALRLWGAEANGLYNVYRDQVFHADLLGGFRYIDLLESLTLQTNEAAVGLPITANLTDRFQTRDQFYGGQIGGRVGVRYSRFTLDVTGKVALGGTHETLNIGGAKSLTVGGFGTTSLPGGIFAEPSNMGHYSRNVFTVVPEVQVQGGVNITQHLRAFVAYNFLYMNNVLRPGNQIDRNVNLFQLTGAAPPAGTPASPAASFHGSSFWAQGISLGLEFRW